MLRREQFRARRFNGISKDRNMHPDNDKRHASSHNRALSSTFTPSEWLLYRAYGAFRKVRLLVFN